MLHENFLPKEYRNNRNTLYVFANITLERNVINAAKRARTSRCNETELKPALRPSEASPFSRALLP